MLLERVRRYIAKVPITRQLDSHLTLHLPDALPVVSHITPSILQRKRSLSGMNCQRAIHTCHDMNVCRCEQVANGPTLNLYETRTTAALLLLLLYVSKSKGTA